MQSFSGEGKSGQLASRFGHVGLRLIVCPNVNSTDRECETNVFEHLVLGFQAQVDDFSIDLWKGLNGSYQTYLFASNFMDAYEEYAIGEFREIYSMPLRMSAKDPLRAGIVATASQPFSTRISDVVAERVVDGQLQ